MNSSFAAIPTSPVSYHRQGVPLSPRGSSHFHWDDMRAWAVHKVTEVSKRIGRNLERFTSSLTISDFGAGQTTENPSSRQFPAVGT